MISMLGGESGRRARNGDARPLYEAVHIVIVIYVAGKPPPQRTRSHLSRRFVHTPVGARIFATCPI